MEFSSTKILNLKNCRPPSTSINFHINRVQATLAIYSHARQTNGYANDLPAFGIAQKYPIKLLDKHKYLLIIISTTNKNKSLLL
jgi:hypothetical protein